MVLEWSSIHIHPRGLEPAWITVEIDHVTTTKSYIEVACVVAIGGCRRLLLGLAR